MCRPSHPGISGAQRGGDWEGSHSERGEQLQFLNIYPRLPDELGSVFAYGIQTQLPWPEIDGRITINSASIPSPLLDHSSFLFDQDIYKENNIPQNDEGLYNLLNQIHTKKNAVFEACITDVTAHPWSRWNEDRAAGEGVTEGLESGTAVQPPCCDDG